MLLALREVDLSLGRRTQKETVGETEVVVAVVVSFVACVRRGCSALPDILLSVHLGGTWRSRVPKQKLSACVGFLYVHGGACPHSSVERRGDWLHAL